MHGRHADVWNSVRRLRVLSGERNDRASYDCSGLDLGMLTMCGVAKGLYYHYGTEKVEVHNNSYTQIHLRVGNSDIE